MIRAPGIQSKVNNCDKLVELVDLYPSLCDLAEIEIPNNMEGISFKLLMKNPSFEWKSAVFSQYHRRPNVTPDKKRYMGFSMVTAEYYFVEWRFWDDREKIAGEVAAVELYNNVKDPDENINIADYPENKKIVELLSEQLNAGWRVALPKN